MNQHKTQAERLAVHLRRRPHTAMEMLQTGISVAPWKRLTETSTYLRPGEHLVKGKDGEGRVTYRIRKAA
jgi:hypothetical protein